MKSEKLKKIFPKGYFNDLFDDIENKEVGRKMYLQAEVDGDRK